ncbi:MAG: SH3 domain-containing protein [Rhizonema sp. PD37]|nr:SH3 domain-containing protein [Rhizonema sp. PD37]
MIVNVLKYFLGIFLAITILAVGGAATALYLMNRSGAIPLKPVFTNDSATLKAQVPKSAVIGSITTSSLEPEPKTKPKAKATSSSKPSPAATPKATESPKALPPGAYQARITWRQGLVLRSEPKQDAERSGGVAFNQKVFVLLESDDKAWQKIRLDGSTQEGWVKAGNTQKADGDDSPQPKKAEPTQKEQ